MAKKNIGIEAFDQFYREVWGSRWVNLRKSLIGSKSYAAVLNPFSDFSTNEPSFDKYENLKVSEKEWENPNNIDSNLLPYYLLDPASFIVSQFLEIKEGDDCLDLCAAPGGKFFSQLHTLKTCSSWHLNDLSHNRLQRLKNIVEIAIPEELKNKIIFTKRDAVGWAKFERNVFDKIFLDAPCSSERHLLEKMTEIHEWKPGRTKRLAKLQWAILTNAFELLKPGGELVYCTCSVSRLENDAIIQKMLDKKGSDIELIIVDEANCEKTEYGIQILPDNGSLGPIYAAKLKKIK